MANGIWIRKRPRGKEVWIVFRESSGKRRREKLGSDTPQFRRLAKEALAKRQFEVSQGKYFPERAAQKTTFGQLCEKYERLWLPTRRSSFAEDRLRNIPESFKAKRAADITPADLQVFYNQKALGTSPTTANRYLEVIKSVFNRAIDWGDFYGENPARKVKTKPDNPYRMRFLSREEMEKFLKVCDARLYPVILCALTTGMRKSEILNLEWQNVDMSNEIIYLLKTKSGKPREIPISSKLCRVLEGLGPQKAGSVFGLPRITFERLFRKAREASGVAHFRVHDLRHTFASHFVMKNADLRAVQEILGHSTPHMTIRYAHLSRPHLRSEMEVLDSVIPSLPELDGKGELATKEATKPGAFAAASQKVV